VRLLFQDRNHRMNLKNHCSLDDSKRQ
jgi:hypothetical protein